MHNLLVFFSIIFLLISNFCYANLAFAKENELGAVEKDIVDEIRKSGFKDFSFVLMDLDKGQIVSSYNQNTPLIPGSVNKIPSTVMGLKVLGADHRFQTRLAINGKVEDGILKGNLYLIGEGDPNLSTPEMFSMLQALFDYGVKKVEKKFIYNDSYLYKANCIDDSGLLDEIYNTGLSALSVDFNQLFLVRNDTNSLDFYKIPNLSSVSLVVTEQRFPPGMNFISKQVEDVVEWKISTRQKYSLLEKLPLKSPGKNSGELFRLLAEQYGIVLPGPEFGDVPDDVINVQVNQSKPLQELVELTLEYSNNLMGEIIFLNATKAFSKSNMDLEQSGKLMLSFYQKELKGSDIVWSDIKFLNGSGLNSKGRVTSTFLAEVLRYADQQNFGKRKFWTLLSVSGNKGTMFERLSSPEFAYKVWAKTGSIDYASALAGYIITNSHKHYAFSIMVNDLKKRAKIDEGGYTNQTLELRNAASGWRSLAQKYQDDLIKSWIQNY